MPLIYLYSIIFLGRDVTDFRLIEEGLEFSSAIVLGTTGGPDPGVSFCCWFMKIKEALLLRAFSLSDNTW